MKLKRFRLKSQMHIWVFSYILVIVLSLLFNSVTYFVAVRSTEKEVVRSNAAVLEHMKNVYDIMFSDAENTVHNLLYSSSVENIMYTNLDNDEMKNEWIRGVIHDAALIRNRDIIKRVYTVFQNDEIAMDAEGLYRHGLLYKLYFKDCFSSKEEWLKMVFDGGVTEYRLIKTSGGERKLFYIDRYISRLMERPAAVVIEIDSQAVKQNLINAVQYDGENMYIADINNNVLFSTDAREIIDFPLNSGEIESIDGVNRLVNCVVSNDNVRKYIYTIPNEQYISSIRIITRTSMISYIMSLIVCGALAYMFSKKQYAQLEKIAVKFEKSGLKNINESEYKYLENMVDKMLGEYRASSSIIEKQSEKLFIAELVKVLKNRIYVDETRKEFIDRFKYDSYSVAVFNILDRGVLADVNMNEDSVHFVIKNVVSELTENFASTVFCETDGLFVCVMNYNSTERSEAEFADKLNFASEFLNQHLEIVYMCAMSAADDDINNLNELYDEAFEMLNYSRVSSRGKVLVYNEKTVDGSEFKYSIDTEKLLMNYLNLGDYENSAKLLEDVIDGNLSNADFSIRGFNLLINELIGTILKVTMDIDGSNELNIRPLYAITAKRVYFTETEWVKQQIYAFVKDLCDLSRSICSEIPDSRIVSIKKYIDENYSDPDLNVNKIADIFNISANYLSSIFKEGTGIRLTDYILKTRIEQAKILLAGNLAINQIALKLGFCDSNGFIKSFKKCEGITPGKYRTYLRQ